VSRRRASRRRYWPRSMLRRHFIALRRTTLRRRQPGQTNLNSARSSTAPSANSRHWGASWWRPAGSRRRCFSAGFTPARSAAPSPSLHQFEPRNLRQPPICTVLFQSRDLSAIACPDVCLSLVPAALKPRLIASVICWGTARNTPNSASRNCLMSSSRTANKSVLVFVGFVIVSPSKVLEPVGCHFQCSAIDGRPKPC
jgi:hypothetical protein